MRRLVLLVSLSAVCMSAADLAEVRSVYLMPMYRGMDQYLANHLANQKVFQVVTDPKLADAVFTDRIGQGFEAQLENMLPAPKPEPKEGKEVSEDDRIGFLADSVNKLESPSLNSTFGRGKGTIFLVELKSRQVVWSTYEPQPQQSLGKEMDRSSHDVVTKLMKDMGLTTKKK